MCFVKGPHKDEERFVSYLIFDYLRLVPLLLSNPSEFSWLLVSFSSNLLRGFVGYCSAVDTAGKEPAKAMPVAVTCDF